MYFNMRNSFKSLTTLIFLLFIAMISSLSNKSSKKLNLHTHKSQMRAPVLNNSTLAKTDEKKTGDNTQPLPPKNLKAEAAKRIDTNDDTHTNSNKPDFARAKNIVCNASNCNNMYGSCSVDKSTCNCHLDYAEYELNKPLKQGKNEGENQQYCQYQRKNQLTYFLLELLLNIGAGHFYAGNNILGGIKLTLVLLPCIVMCIAGCLGGMSSDGSGGGKILFGTALAYAALCAVSIWWLVDVIVIATAGYTDGHGVPLKHW